MYNKYFVLKNINTNIVFARNLYVI